MESLGEALASIAEPNLLDNKKGAKSSPKCVVPKQHSFNFQNIPLQPQSRCVELGESSDCVEDEESSADEAQADS